jgi:hypothetical protein
MREALEACLSGGTVSASSGVADPSVSVRSAPAFARFAASAGISPSSAAERAGDTAKGTEGTAGVFGAVASGSKYAKDRTGAAEGVYGAAKRVASASYQEKTSGTEGVFNKPPSDGRTGTAPSPAQAKTGRRGYISPWVYLAVMAALFVMWRVLLSMSYVSGGKEFELPDFTNSGLNETIDSLNRMGLSGQIARRINHNDIPSDYVIYQTPAPLTWVKKRTIVTLVVSDGPVMEGIPSSTDSDAPEYLSLPSFAGMTVNEAKEALAYIGLGVGLIIYGYQTVPEEDGSQIVTGQYPEAGSSVLIGYSVNLIIGEEPETDGDSETFGNSR